MEIDAREAATKSCPWRNFESCLGDMCMAWRWADRPYEECETDNIITTEDGPRPEGVPPSPGEGWEPHGQPFNKSYEKRAKLNLPMGTAQRWRLPRRVMNGSCARVNTGYW